MVLHVKLSSRKTKLDENQVEYIHNKCWHVGHAVHLWFITISRGSDKYSIYCALIAVAVERGGGRDGSGYFAPGEIQSFMDGQLSILIHSYFVLIASRMISYIAQLLASSPNDRRKQNVRGPASCTVNVWSDLLLPTSEAKKILFCVHFLPFSFQQYQSLNQIAWAFLKYSSNHLLAWSNLKLRVFDHFWSLPVSSWLVNCVKTKGDCCIQQEVYQWSMNCLVWLNELVEYFRTTSLLRL